MRLRTHLEATRTRRRYIEGMRPLVLAFIGLFQLVLSPWDARGQSPPAPVVEVSESEYQVLSEYIASAFTGDTGRDRVGRPVSKIVIVSKAYSGGNDNRIEDDEGKPLSWKEASGQLEKEFPALQPASINSLHEVINRPAKFRHSFRLPVAYELVDKAEIDAIFKKGGWWTDYYKSYPDSQGLLSLSRVGFSPDGKQAVFFASNACGGKCGTGAYVVMERIDSGWKVAREILIWVS
jgi:hypothetical protein